MQIDMRRIDPSLNMNRFYSVELTKDLFGHHGVHRQWGRFGTWGRHRHDWYATESEAESALTDLVKQKLTCGYLIQPPPSNSQDRALEALISFDFQPLSLTAAHGKAEKLQFGRKKFFRICLTAND